MLDQFGIAMANQPSLSWSTACGASIDANGLFTASATPGDCSVVAARGSLRGTASATVLLGLKDSTLDELTKTVFTDDRKIDRQEMIQVLRSTGADDQVVDAAEFGDLKTILSKGALLGIPDYVQALAGDVINGNLANGLFQGQPLGNLAAGSSVEQLSKLVDKWFLGADHPAAVSYTYRRASGSLFVGGPAHTDMIQGIVARLLFHRSLGGDREEFSCGGGEHVHRQR